MSTVLHNDICTDRLRLRSARPEDADWMAREIANPNVLQWLTNPPSPYSLADAETYIASRKDDASYRVICAREQPVGVVSLTQIHKDVPDLGYWLAQGAWGQGYMTEAAGALIDWHFENGGAPIESGWLKGNAASQNVLTKLGFCPLSDAVQ